MIFDIRVHEEYIYIIPSKENTLVKASLRINRRTKKIEEQLQVKLEGKFIGSKSIAYLMGIFRYQQHSFIAIVDQKDRVAQIGQQRIYRIRSISYIQIEVFMLIQNEKQERLGTEVYQTLHGQKELMTRYGFYYSINGDITQAKQYQKHEDSFCWNYTLLNYIQENGLSQQWYFPIIQGYVEQIETVIDNQQIYVILITRRSRFMGGTRYYSRGINDEGYVANFNETEQILIINNFIFSFVSVRGSVPLFWQQDNNMSVKLSRSLDLTITAFQKHFDQLINRYGLICCINLMQRDKELESQLSNGFQELILRQQNNKVKYAHIDFHSLVKQGSSQRLNPTIYDLKQMINETFQFYLQDNLQQKGIFRVNCLDCLDRTNLYMSKIYFYILNIQLKTLGFKLSANDDILDLFDESNKKLQSDLVIKFKSLWANNGDMISQIYAGTDSTVSQMIRDGKQNFLGMLVQGYRNAERMYNSKFEDDNKQSSINALIQDQKQLDQDIVQSNINIHVITWNVGGKLPQQQNFLQTLLNFQELNNPDVIIFGLQEMVNLNPQNVMVLSNDKNKLIWNNIFQANLQQIDSYILLAEVDLIGIQLQLYIKDIIKHRISKIETDIIKTGMNGILGNKGGVIVKFNIDDSQLSIINCHLTSGNSSLSDRLRDINDIHEKAFQQSKNTQFKNNDYCFFLGDMNFRIDLQYQEVIDKTFQYQQLLNQDDHKMQKARQILQYLLNNDQLNKVKNENQILKQYNEGGIDFLPTYKYDQYSNVYDTSKKRRIPSWCDRILLKSREDFILQQHFYNRRECLDSDHRPVTSYYTIEVKKLQKVQQIQPVQQKPQQQIQQQQYQFQQIDLL